jgi:HSP90 family molecular chaperone
MLSVFFLSIFINPLVDTTSVSTDQNLKMNEFFSDFENDRKSIFLIGSSHIARYNHTYIQEQINNEKKEYTIFNLSIDGDYPKNRLNSIINITSLNPDLVLYGVSHWEFADEMLKSELSKPKSIFPDPAIYLKKTIQHFEEIFNVNFKNWNHAKILTINLIKNTIGIDDVNSTIDLPVENLPFNQLRKSNIDVLDDLSLKRNFESNVSQIEKIYSNHENVFALKQMIDIFQQNNIPVILFSSPASDIYLNSISDDDQKNFEYILKEISKNQKVEVIFLHDKFRHDSIWNDPTHMAYNPKSNLVYDEIISIIENNLE